MDDELEDVLRRMQSLEMIELALRSVLLVDWAGCFVEVSELGKLGVVQGSIWAMVECWTG